MAEKIIDIKLNSKEAEKQLEALDKDIQQLEDNVQDFNQELFKLETQLAKTSKGSKQYKELNDKIKLTKNSIKRETLELKANNKQKQKLNKQTTQLNKKLKQQAKNHNDVSKGLTKTIGGTGVLDRATGGLFSSFQGLTQGSTGLIRSLGLIRVAMYSIPIVAIVTALGSLVAAFTSSEEGQNKLTKALNQAKAVMTNVISVATELGNNLLNIGSSIKNFFTGKGGLGDIGEAITNTYENVSERISTLGEDIKEDVKAAAELSDMVAKADKIDRALLVQRQKDNIKINDLRTKAYNTEKFNNQERIKFLEDAVKIEDNITNKEIEAARLRFEAKKAENDMVAEVRREDADEQAALEAKLFELEAKKINRQREVSNQRQMILRKEKAEQEKIERDAAKAEEERLKELEEKRIEDAKTEKERLLQEQQDIKERRQQEFEDKLNTMQAEEDARQQQYATMATALNAFQNIATLMGKKGKGIAIAGIVVDQVAAVSKIISNTAIGNARALAELGPVASVPAIAAQNLMAGASIASSVTGAAVAIQKINSNAKTTLKPSVPVPKTGASSSPSINVVGAAPENQLAQVLGEQEQKPVKAFVVSSDVSTAQSLDRNIIDNASIG